MRLIDADKLDMSVKVDGDRTLSPISQLIAQTIIENAQTIESDEDCISRKHLEERIKFASEMSADETDDFKLGVSAVLLLIKAEPSIQPKAKVGHWEQFGNSWEDKFKCSECGKEQPKILCGERIIGHWSDFCPNCGVKMEGADE